MVARKNGWLNEVCKHMSRPIIWSEERCQEEALKYKSRNEFQIGSRSAYIISLRKGWLNKICSHMNYKCNNMTVRSTIYWTKINCHNEAMKYETRNEFRKKSHIAYLISRKNGWLDDICAHMRVIGNLYKRCIYAFEFPDKHVYVGLTFNTKVRNRDHDIRGAVFEYRQFSGLTPVHKQLTPYTDIKEAVNQEKQFVENYTKNGWIVLNKKKTGGVGWVKN